MHCRRSCHFSFHFKIFKLFFMVYKLGNQHFFTIKLKICFTLFCLKVSFIRALKSVYIHLPLPNDIRTTNYHQVMKVSTRCVFYDVTPKGWKNNEVNENVTFLLHSHQFKYIMIHLMHLIWKK